MRMLILNHFPLEGSGSGVYTKNLARELSEMGHVVKVVFPEIEIVKSDIFETRVILSKGEGTKNPEKCDSAGKCGSESGRACDGNP